MTEPTTAAEPTPYGDVEEVFELAVWIVGLLGYAKKGGYEGEARPGVAWERLRPAILAIEAEARQQDGSALRAALERPRLIGVIVKSFAIRTEEREPRYLSDDVATLIAAGAYHAAAEVIADQIIARAALPPSAPASGTCGYLLAHVNVVGHGPGPSPCGLPEGHRGWHAYPFSIPSVPPARITPPGIDPATGMRYSPGDDPMLPPSAPPALDEKGGCYFCGATGIASHAGCRGGNVPLPEDEDIERWYAAFARVSGLDAKRLPGKRVIWERFAAEYARLQERDR